MNSQKTKLKLYYDGACHLCSREIEGYLKKDPNQFLMPIDISGPDFDPEKDGIEVEKANKYFHVKKTTGEILDGVPAFAAIWDTLEILKPLSWFSKTSLGSFAMGSAYKVFAEIRPLLPKRRGCETCKI
jgi:predicted DCC family thiol-disulfide oxidoreductase YuxK